MRRLLSGMGLGLFVIVLGMAPASAASNPPGPVNNVQAITTAGQMVSQLFNLQVASQQGNDTATNDAVAYAHDCTGCRSVAVAFQVVFVVGPTTNDQPTNVGLAENYKCTGCFVYADADQDIVPVARPFSLNHPEQAQLSQIAQEGQQLATSGDNADQMNAGFAQLAAEEHTDIANDVRLMATNQSNTDWTGASLPGFLLPGYNFSGADLSGADLAGANLAGANLSNANLSDANFSNSNLTGANLAGADTTGTNFTGARR
jgi:hypothetical protein